MQTLLQGKVFFRVVIFQENIYPRKIYTPGKKTNRFDVNIFNILILIFLKRQETFRNALRQNFIFLTRVLYFANSKNIYHDLESVLS